MSHVTAGAGELPVYCANPNCRKLSRNGAPQIVGYLAPGSAGRLYCGKCRQHTAVQIPTDNLLDVVASLVAM